MVEVHGAGGELRVGYQHAATVGAWTLTTTPGPAGVRVALTCALVEADPFWVTQRPVDVVLDWYGGCRVWRAVRPAETSPLWRFPTLGTPEVL